MTSCFSFFLPKNVNSHFHTKKDLKHNFYLVGFCLFKMPFFDLGRPLVDSLNLISLEHSSASPPCSQWRALRFSSPPLSSPLPAAAPSDLSSLSLSLESSSSLLSESKTFVILYMYKKALIATFDTNYLSTKRPL